MASPVDKYCRRCNNLLLAPNESAIGVCLLCVSLTTNITPSTVILPHYGFVKHER